MMLLEAKDNHGRLRQAFIDKLAALDDMAFMKEAERRIWLSAYANNNPRSDFHWQADACYEEAQVRGKPKLYELAWRRASSQ